MEMRLRTPVTRGYFFLLGALRLVNAASPRTISVHKKKISSGAACLEIYAFFSALEYLVSPLPSEYTRAVSKSALGTNTPRIAC